IEKCKSLCPVPIGSQLVDSVQTERVFRLKLIPLRLKDSRKLKRELSRASTELRFKMSNDSLRTN
ncbi:hypothetical protein RDWZM_006308, partial [Blomia tropicalis]